MIDPLSPDYTPPDRHDILAAINRMGGSLSKLANQHGLHRTSCTNALTIASAAGEFAIAEFLEVHPAALWPERYRNPTPKRLRYLEANHSRIQRWAKCLKQAAR